MTRWFPFITLEMCGDNILFSTKNYSLRYFFPSLSITSVQLSGNKIYFTFIFVLLWLVKDRERFSQYHEDVCGSS